MTKSVKKISTSALSKDLGFSSNELFEYLNELNLIYKEDGKWHLTRRGIDCGGEMASNPKYGEYVVWPADFDPDTVEPTDRNQLINATAIGNEFNLSSQKVNLILSEIGWIEKAIKGWSLTNLGIKVGGVEFEHKSGGSFVLWPPELLTNKSLVSSLNPEGDGIEKQPTELNGNPEVVEDLKDSKDFREKFPAGLRTKDGHLVRSRGEILIDNSLYEYGLAHAYERRLPIEEEVYCDFYIPSQNNGKAVYIEYWGMENDEKYQARKEKKKQIYKDNHLNLLELENTHIESLDDYLPKMLLKYGFRVD
ncbi:phage antirepressor KilAC domain-containing protein [Maribellus sediminis]|uniref:phage antirepressor KilAC domain-containing protein n=1 Tax=Maribellus sediminis TaxID=2696285 RepID=UPI00143189DF|nr:glycerol kinase [Maribellus sediminis]